MADVLTSMRMQGDELNGVLQIIRESADLPDNGEIELDFDTLSQVCAPRRYPCRLIQVTQLAGLGAPQLPVLSRPASTRGKHQQVHHAMKQVRTPEHGRQAAACRCFWSQAVQIACDLLESRGVPRSAVPAPPQETLWQLDRYLQSINKGTGQGGTFQLVVRT